VLLPIALDFGDRARSGGVGVLAELATGAAPPKQIPTLIEGLFGRLKSLVLLGGVESARSQTLT
jgi:hypothetical protein